MKRAFLAGILLISIFSMGYFSRAMALADISSAYSAPQTENIQVGELVSSNNKPNQITLANSNNGQHLLGVALSVKDSVVSISPSSHTASVQVAFSGTVNVYVSTINGNINSGDSISVSPLSGIGMKAGSNGLNTVGTAQANFTNSSSGKHYTATSKSGKKKQILIGTIPVSITIGSGAASSNSNENSGFVGNLRTAAAAIVGHPVSALQAILSFLVVIIAISSLIALVYGAIHNAIVAVGRNPLAKISIYKSLSGVAGIAFLIALVAMSIVYFTLR